MARPRVHVAISAALAAVAWSRSHRLAPAVAPIVGGFLIDVDHLIDYAIYRRLGTGRLLVLPLHGWEWVPIFALLERRFAPSTRGMFTVGYVAHLLVDQVANEMRTRAAYLVSYRASQGFSSRLLGPESERIAHAWRRTAWWKLWKWF